MIDNETQLLIEALEKKEKILKEVLSCSQEQNAVAKSDEFDEDKFDNLFDQKTELLSQMELIDSGFDTVFRKIKEELIQNKDHYKSEISRLQELIKSTMDLGAQIYATENRTKNMMEQIIQNRRMALSKRKMSSRSVMDYYKSNSTLGGIDSVFLDAKQ